MDRISKEALFSMLDRKAELIYLDVTDSTNNYARSIALEGALEGTAVIAERQTQGRGRMGRSFLSESEGGLYFSIILRPRISPERSIYITVIGALAVAEAIESVCHRECKIKWVNDIYIGDKKVSGILTEGSIDFSRNMLDHAIIGIGVNIEDPQGGFPQEIKDIAGSVCGSCAPRNIKGRLLAEIYNNFFRYYSNIEDGSYMEKYRRRSNMIGKIVDVYRGDEIISGVCIDIDEDANLVIDANGKAIKFNSGDARVKRS